MDYPGYERELEILNARVPEASAELSRQVVAFVQRLRGEDLFARNRAWPRPLTGRNACWRWM